MTENDSGGGTDQFEFIYGDDHGDIDIMELGTHQGTIARQMDIPDRLARDLYEDLHDHFRDVSEKYVVYGTEDLFIANVCIVEATSEDDAIEKARDHAGYIGSRPRAKKVDEHPTHGDVWAAVI